ncbi:glycosyl hydrolase family 10-domain-containing protein [Neocallimastix sp. 'constans']
MKFSTANKILFSSLVASANAYDLLKDYAGDLKVGVAANSMRFSNSNYVNAMKAFNMMVAENDCKLSGIQQQKGVYNFNGCDNHYNKAKELGMEFRGHCLIWHSYQPSWFQNADANTLKNAIVDHITKTLQHYEGKIKVWDVVNEAIDDNSNGNGWNMRRSFLYNKVPNFVDLAFQTARKVSPNTKLFYNDYNAEGVYAKAESIYNFVSDLKKRNIPIDGVGLQYHVGAREQPSYNKINDLIGRYCKLGLEVHITELDVKLQGDQNGQSQAFSNALKACLANSCCKAFLVWGVGDNDSWLGANEQALLFNGNYQPKPVYNTLLNILKTSARPASSSVKTIQGNSKTLPGNSKTLPGNSKTLPGNSKTLPGNSKTLPGNSKTLPGNSKTLPGNSKTLPGNSKTLPGNSKTLPGNSKTLPGNSKTLPGNSKTLPGNSKTLPGNSKTLPGNSKTLPGNSKTLPGNSKTLPGNSKTLPGNSKTLPGNSKTLPGNSKTLPGNSKTLPGNSKTLPGNSKTLPGNSKTLPGNSKTLPGGSKTLPKTSKTLPGGSKTLPKTSKTLPGGSNCKPSTVTVTQRVTVTVTVESRPTQGGQNQSGGNCAAKWGQCGGNGFNGPTCCQSGSQCQFVNEWYSQCL